jgi:uridylate kinase
MTALEDVPYKRILVKLSGEALLGEESYGISIPVMQYIINEIASVRKLGVQVAIVIGGGNIFRGVSGVAQGMDRTTADHMGMLATVMNSLALKDALNQAHIPATVLSAIKIGKIARPFMKGQAVNHLEDGRIVIFAAGTGNPFFTTDTAAALRALEINADVLFKGTRVDGIYDKDPVKFPDATLFHELTYKEALDKELKIMDATAFLLARDARLPIVVFNILKPGRMELAVRKKETGTLVKGDI